MSSLPSTELIQFAQDFQQEIVTEASTEGSESMLPEAFTTLVLQDLDETGEFVEPHICHHRQRGMEVSGWGWDDLDGTLYLAVTVFNGGGTQTLQKRELDAAFKRVDGFFVAALKGLYKDLEEASPQWDLAYFVHDNQSVIERVRYYLITDGVTNVEPEIASAASGFAITQHVWDIARLHRLQSSGAKREAIDIDLVSRFGSALPALPAPTASSDFESYLLVIPGAVLASLYDEYGARLLELNVRSFLQARGKVNKGIRDTIINEPDRFFAYNNGISATASKVEADTGTHGTAGITRIVDLQIVNGGQTTASIATAAKKDKASLERVFVQAKLTVVPGPEIDNLVPLISRYANSQNKVSEADLSANHKFHVAMEELSRTIWAPSPDGGSRETRWFYERARGQYQDAVNRERTPARMRAFRTVHPTRQKFTKTDLAKFAYTWDQKPHLVSRGAQKNFVEFMSNLSASSTPDEEYFKQTCALGIMFRETERIVTGLKFGGYRANIVTYTLALLANRMSMRVDLDQIWNAQAIGPELTRAIESLAPSVFQHIASPPNQQNVTEWCKKEKCWTDLRDKNDIQLEASLRSELDALASAGKSSPRRVGSAGGPTAEQKAEIDWVQTIPEETWFAISTWAKETDQLQSWQRGLSFSLGKIRQSERSPSPKQAKQGKILFDEAMRLGFKANES